MTDAGRSEPESDDGTTSFPAGAPDVALGGLELWRSTITSERLVPPPHAEAGSTDAETSIEWSVTFIFTQSSEVPALLVGDLACRRGDWFVGATAAAHLNFRESLEAYFGEATSIHAMGEALAQWGSSALYDYASAAARNLIASVRMCDADVPVLTPPASISALDFGEDDEDDEVP